MKAYVLLLMVFAFISCSSRHPATTDSTNQDSITAKIFQLKDSSGNVIPQWGYDVFVHGKLMLHQPNIPAVQGNHGFSSEEDAKKVADLAVFKISNHIIPPTITTEELDSLNIGPYNGGY